MNGKAQYPSIDFLGQRKIALAISSALILISILSLAFRGLNLGVDFTGGTVIELGYQQPVELAVVRSALAGAGFHNASVQHFGTTHDLLVRLAPEKGQTSAQISSRVVEALTQASKGNAPQVRRVEYVGPQVGGELLQDGSLALLVVLIAILIYIAVRFEYRFAVGAVIATVHDPIITVGVFSVFQIEFDLNVLAAVLAIMGYSVNDTIVVFDRIRENFRKMRKGTTTEIMNASVNQMLSRTIMTSLTTLMVCVALFLFGGQILHGFSLAMIVGIVVGTYSSIYVASVAALMLGVSRADLMPLKKESESGKAT